MLPLAVLLLLSGCRGLMPAMPATADASLEPQEFLDNRTGVTVTGAAEPLVLAHDEPALAVNARDYLSLGVIEVNRIGDLEHYLVVVAWSTIDRARLRGTLYQPAVPERLALGIDGRTVKLVAGDGTGPVRDRELYPTPAAASARRFFRVDAATLRAMVGARRLMVQVDRGEEGMATYHPWGRRGVEALRRFAAGIDRGPDRLPDNAMGVRAEMR